VCHRGTACRGDACGSLVGGLTIAAVDHHGGTVPRQVGATAGPDTARTADDDGAAARQ
jgi:hypothetical protein